MDAFRGRVTDDFSPTTIDEFVPEMIELASRVETWGVWRGEGSEEELGGMVSVLVESRNPRLGLARSLFKQDFWVDRAAEGALRQVYAAVFEGGVEKICTQAFSDSYQIIGLAQALGAVIEGRLRKQTLRGGKPADLVMLGLLKEDFETCKPPQ